MRLPGLTAHRAVPIVRWLAAREATRRVLNGLYQPRSWDQKERVHARFAKIFRDYQGPFAPGVWEVEFAGRTCTTIEGACVVDVGSGAFNRRART